MENAEQTGEEQNVFPLNVASESITSQNESARVEQLERLLAQSYTRFALIAKATRQAIWDWDLVTNQVWRNEGFATLFGYTSQDIGPDIEWWFGHIHPYDRARIRDSITAVIASKGHQWIERYRFFDKTGTYHFILDRGYIVYNEKGESYQMLGCMEDITKQKKAKDELLESQYKFKLLSETIPQLIWTATPDGLVDYVNCRWIEYTGLSMEQSKNYGWATAFHPEDLPTLQEHWQKALYTTNLHQVEARIRNVEGIYRWFLIRAMPLKDSQGQVIEWFGTNTDIEEQKRLSEQLQTLTEQLSVANDTLQFTNERLSRTNEELDQYVYKVSHDIRSPIASIVGLLSLLEQEELYGQAQVYVDLIRNRIGRLDEFIRSVLTHSRSVNTAVTAKPINFNQIIEQCLEEISYMPDMDKVEIYRQLPSSRSFYGDELRISIVLKNLIANAIKYRREEVRCMISICVCLQEREAIIKVEDNGQGIEEIYQQKVFTMFFRANEKAEGSGLGLYIVKQAVERMGGSITLKSHPNQGSLFTVTLPNLQENGNTQVSNKTDECNVE
ncbi:PAS domain-containing sensor histidine kinase [Cytophagaceae bacterium YF14B1]|uniref:histidine kinase n=1 Tax=Xanthocytophaga flava TaxID=3048013 RepID=A0AAE3QQL5_9BACT|nr:PAS domain-containing sensor histidine kinase [Xanthocytophaga flavus]MDJ1480938.1 PAS domain-containing sensor histidine kinase [Xanthocytophaga flavus]